MSRTRTNDDDDGPIEETLPGRTLLDNIKLGAGIGVLAALVAFVLQNRNNEQVDFLAWGLEIPLALALLLAAALGAIISWLFSTVRARRIRRIRER